MKPMRALALRLGTALLPLLPVATVAVLLINHSRSASAHPVTSVTAVRGS